MIQLFLFCVVVGLFWAFILTPIFIIGNRRKLKRMNALIDAFKKTTFANDDAAAQARFDLRRSLIEIKAKMYSGDKDAIEKARDLLTLF